MHLVKCSDRWCIIIYTTTLSVVQGKTILIFPSSRSLRLRGLIIIFEPQRREDTKVNKKRILKKLQMDVISFLR
ncbi:hypothetical protein [Fischerella sp. JS2]|uniref:hypothetical protein n=1 Tax=Fischerella sp. JS2 TaxID=2597771 RepID=UPI0028E469B7|nr:hypothetical protein [Fischerella sp. JS2]